MKIKFEPRDMWIGIYWNPTSSYCTLEKAYQCYTAYLCLIPCFPIVFVFKRRVKWSERHKLWEGK